MAKLVLRSEPDVTEGKSLVDMYHGMVNESIDIVFPSITTVVEGEEIAMTCETVLFLGCDFLKKLSPYIIEASGNIFCNFPSIPLGKKSDGTKIDSIQETVEYAWDWARDEIESLYGCDDKVLSYMTQFPSVVQMRDGKLAAEAYSAMSAVTGTAVASVPLTPASYNLIYDAILIRKQRQHMSIASPRMIHLPLDVQTAAPRTKRFTWHFPDARVMVTYELGPGCAETVSSWISNGSVDLPVNFHVKTHHGSRTFMYDSYVRYFESGSSSLTKKYIPAEFSVHRYGGKKRKTEVIRSLTMAVDSLGLEPDKTYEEKMREVADVFGAGHNASVSVMSVLYKADILDFDEIEGKIARALEGHDMDAVDVSVFVSGGGKMYRIATIINGQISVIAESSLSLPSGAFSPLSERFSMYESSGISSPVTGDIPGHEETSSGDIIPTVGATISPGDAASPPGGTSGPEITVYPPSDIGIIKPSADKKPPPDLVTKLLETAKQACDAQKTPTPLTLDALKATEGGKYFVPEPYVGNYVPFGFRLNN
jgi:hypothetical protein